MPFIFKCPQGHELQADETQIGQSVMCPQCGTTFFVPHPHAPTPPPTPDAPPVHGAADEGFGQFPQAGGGRSGSRFGFLDEGASPTGGGAIPEVNVGGEFGAEFAPSDAMSDRNATIPCPNGHAVVVPYDTMGQEILCPHCGEPFVLRYSDSYEYQHEQARKEAAQDYKLGKTWFVWAIVAACAVVVLLVVLIVASSK